MNVFLKPPEDWWERSFAAATEYRPNREWTMLMVVAYDITDPRRLARIAKYCEDFGGRVQYSVFEVRLNQDQFETFWNGLVKRMDEKSDRIVAYRVCNECARKIRSAGTMALTEEPPPAYIM